MVMLKPHQDMKSMVKKPNLIAYYGKGQSDKVKNEVTNLYNEMVNELKQ